VQLLVIVAAVLIFWRLVMRPARNQQRTMQQLQTELLVGDEVVISAGVFGTVRELEEDRVRLEVAPGTVITVARQVVVRRAEEDLRPAPADARAIDETTGTAPIARTVENDESE
jgi:preprotein translocase subunit YajC